MELEMLFCCHRRLLTRSFVLPYFFSFVRSFVCLSLRFRFSSKRWTTIDTEFGHYVYNWREPLVYIECLIWLSISFCFVDRSVELHTNHSQKTKNQTVLCFMHEFRAVNWRGALAASSAYIGKNHKISMNIIIPLEWPYLLFDVN